MPGAMLAARWRRAAVRCALGASVLLAPAPAAARDLAPTGDIAEDFRSDPAAGGDWRLSRAWRWDGLAGTLTSPSTARRASASWTRTEHYTGELSLRLKLIAGRSGRAPRARVVFGRNPESGAYRYVQVTAGRPGRITLGQAGRIGKRTAGAIRSAPVDFGRRVWHAVGVVFDGRGRVTVLLDGQEVLTETVRPLAPGQVGFAALASRVAVDELSFTARPDGEPCLRCHAGQAAYPLAPDVARYWDGSWWDGTMGGGASEQQGGHGDPGGRFALGCAGGSGCHDLRLPSPGDHRNGTIEAGALVTLNPKHLREIFIEERPGSPWDVQMRFDDACATACHDGYGLPDMRHFGVTAGRPYLQLGYGLTDPQGGAIPADVPVDSDLSSAASPGPPIYATCVTCHDPHGTGVADTTHGSNHMLRRGFTTTSALCTLCHV